MGIRKLKRSMMRKNKVMLDEKTLAVWFMHFGHLGLNPGEGATCKDCMDFIEGACHGGWVPEECMADKSKRVEFIG